VVSLRLSAGARGRGAFGARFMHSHRIARAACVAQIESAADGAVYKAFLLFQI
jgi:hypothetical protein